MKSRVAPVLLLLAGCGMTQLARPYTTPKGDTPVTIANPTIDGVCRLEIASKRDNELAWDPLAVEGDPAAPHRRLEIGRTLEVRLKPGTYRVDVVSCDKRFGNHAAVVVVNGPTRVELGRGGVPIEQFSDLPAPQIAERCPPGAELCTNAGTMR